MEKGVSHIAVILVPVVDPQLTVRQLSVGGVGNLKLETVKHVLGPYDEAALENALALRDKLPGSIVTAIVFGGAAANEALRYAMALKVDAALWVALDPAASWDTGATAQGIASTVRALENEPDLVLMAPEFGDHDDGVVPPLVAKRLGRIFFAAAYKVMPEADNLVLSRDAGDFEERLTTAAPVLVTVSTHPSVRLRLPLLKNIMAANRRQVSNETARPDAQAETKLESFTLAGAGRKRGADCRMLEGAAEEKAAALATLIREKVKA
jgi:electron transfer flavoprotein beta subunit